MTAYVPGMGERDLNRLILSLQQLAAGRSNAVGTVTCSTLATTTVSDANCFTGSKINLTATSTNAANALSALYISAKASGSFTIAHTVASTTDRTFDYTIHG